MHVVKSVIKEELWDSECADVHPYWLHCMNMDSITRTVRWVNKHKIECDGEGSFIDLLGKALWKLASILKR